MHLDEHTVTGRVLIVEDDASHALLLTRVLQRAGFDTQRSVDADSAWPLLGGERWDALVTDIEMPGMSGLELMRLARQGDSSLAIIVVTASVTTDRLHAACAADAELVAKPVHPTSFVPRVHAAIRRARRGHR